MSDDHVAMRLDLIAARAAQLASDVRSGRLWGGDLSKGLQDIHEQMRHLGSDPRVKRDGGIR